MFLHIHSHNSLFSLYRSFYRKDSVAPLPIPQGSDDDLQGDSDSDEEWCVTSETEEEIIE